MAKYAPVSDDVEEEEENEGPRLGLGQIARAYWNARRLVGVIIAASVLLAVGYALFISEPEYLAKAVIGPVDSGGSLGGSGTKQALSALAGMDLGSIGSGGFNKFSEVMTSTELAAHMEAKYHVMPMFFAGWDPKTKTWLAPSGPIADAKNFVKAAVGMPAWTAPNASALSLKLNAILDVQKVGGNSPLDFKNQISVVTLRYKDPQVAVQLLSEILLESDRICRDAQLQNSSNRIAYLTRLVDQTQEVTLREGLRQLLINEEQTFVSLSANRYYAFDMIDPPSVNYIPLGMTASKKILFGFLMGVALSLVVVYAILRARVARFAGTLEDPLAGPFPDPFVWPAQVFRSLFGQASPGQAEAVRER